MDKKLYDLKIDSDFANLIPPLQDNELAILSDSILANGCEMPLVVWGGTVVDGHNRYRICHENGVPFAIEEKKFESREAAKIWLIRNQLGRRNLPDFQKCELVLPLEELLKAEAENSRRKAISTFRRENETVPNLAPSQSRTRDALATMAGVSHGTLDKAKKIIESADEGTKDRLRKGEISIHRAYTELKQSEPKKDDFASLDVPALEKGSSEKPAAVSLLKKPVFEHYEPPTYMAPIPFEPVIPAAPEAISAETGDPVSLESEAATDVVQDLILAFLSDLDEALGTMDHRGMALALEMIRDAGEKAEQTVKKHLNKLEEQP